MCDGHERVIRGDRLKTRVLVVEDDRLLAHVLCDTLSLEGFDVVRVASGVSAVTKTRDFLPDLIILDVMLPDSSGFELFHILNATRRTPVIFLTARGESADRIRGLRLGADDYVTKPFDVEELVARVHAVLRRANALPSQVTLGDLEVDFIGNCASRAGRVVHLTHREFEVLRYLAERTARVVHRGELLRAIWGYPDGSAYTRSVDQAIARLRRKIEPDPQSPMFIHTVRGDGYLLTPSGPAST